MAGAATYGTARKLGAAKSREFSTVSSFKLGYRNREDVTNLPPGVLIVGSQNVLTNVSERVQIRQGYALDGPTSSIASGTGASFDWLTRGNGEVHLRAGGLTSAGNDGHLQYRYVDGSGIVTWRDLLSGLTTVAYNFTTFFDQIEKLRECVFVNGTSNLFIWNGAMATIASSDNTAGHISTIASAPTAAGTGYTVGDVLAVNGGTGGTVTVASVTAGVINAVALTSTGSGYSSGTGKATTGGTGTGATINITAVATGQITIAGTTSTLDSGFYTSSNLNLVINGNTYAYTNLVGTSFVGISPDATGEAMGSVIIQAVVTIPNSSLTGACAPPTTFKNDLISVLNNQIYLGSLTSSAIFVGNQNPDSNSTGVITNFDQTSPRQANEGATLILDANMVAFIVQGATDAPTMYFIAGKDLWYKNSLTDFVSATGASGQDFGAILIKTGSQQAAQSQAYVSHMKNDVIALTNEPTIDLLGVAENYFTQIQTTNISDPIKLDMDGYDFTGGSIFYWRFYILVAIPREGIVRIYNLNTKNWEAPQTVPISRFYIVNGELYGHSSNTFESYQLFTGYADRVYPGFTGFPIAAVWNFSYENYGTRFSYKKATKFYVEGYINQNTTLNCKINYELDGCMTSRTFTLAGNNAQFVCISSPEGSLGQDSIGKIKLGGDQTASINGLPPKFRWIPTFSNKDFFEANFQFSVLGTNNRAELLAFGLNASGSSEIPVQNTN